MSAGPILLKVRPLKADSEKRVSCVFCFFCACRETPRQRKRSRNRAFLKDRQSVAINSVLIDVELKSLDSGSFSSFLSERLEIGKIH